MWGEGCMVDSSGPRPGVYSLHNALTIDQAVYYQLTYLSADDWKNISLSSYGHYYKKWKYKNLNFM